jgi:hypothetical protein
MKANSLLLTSAPNLLPLMNKWLCFEQLNIISERYKPSHQADFLNCVGRASSRLEPTFCNISCRCSRIHAATPASIRWSSASSRMALASLSRMAALLSRAVSKCNNCSSDTPISQLIGITDFPNSAPVRQQPATRLSSVLQCEIYSLPSKVSRYQFALVPEYLLDLPQVASMAEVQMHRGGNWLQEFSQHYIPLLSFVSTGIAPARS